MKNIFNGIGWILIITLIFFVIINLFFEDGIIFISKNGDLLSFKDFISLNKVICIPLLFCIVSLIPGFVLIIEDIKKRLIK